jgi:hypothetical protein
VRLFQPITAGGETPAAEVGGTGALGSQDIPLSRPVKRLAVSARRVMIFTMGMNTLHQVIDSPAAQELYRLKEADASRSDLRNAVKNAARALGVGDNMFAIDTRQLKESRASLLAANAWHHCGDNPGNLNRIVNHKAYAGLLGEAKRAVHDWQGRPTAGDLQIVCYCNAGRDRSVGYAVLLSNILQELGQEVVVTHWCQPVWRWHARGPCSAACLVCFGTDAKQAKVAESRKALEIWHCV